MNSILPPTIGLPNRAFFERPAYLVAPDLLGAYLIRYRDTDRSTPHLAARIVETEAYEQSDPASHSYRGETERTKSMFGPAGHAYVYLIYGMHFCFNVVCEKAGIGSAVLIRAVEPVLGEEEMRKLRPKARRRPDITNGPAKLAQAFGITRQRDDGTDLLADSLRIYIGHRQEDQSAFVAPRDIGRSRRIGISKATELEWRFFVADSTFVSR